MREGKNGKMFIKVTPVRKLYKKRINIDHIDQYEITEIETMQGEQLEGTVIHIRENPIYVEENVELVDMLIRKEIRKLFSLKEEA